MPLTPDNWMKELDDAIVAHIDHYVPTDVQIILEDELPRAFTKPVITIGQFDGNRRNTGGMNTVGTKQQGYWQELSYYITVNTDDTDYADPNVPKGKMGRDKVAAELDIVAFSMQKHQLANATGGALIANLRSVGPILGGGPLADRTIYQRAFFLDIEVIVPFTSVVI